MARRPGDEAQPEEGEKSGHLTLLQAVSFYNSLPFSGPASTPLPQGFTNTFLKKLLVAMEGDHKMGK